MRRSTACSDSSAPPHMPSSACSRCMGSCARIWARAAPLTRARPARPVVAAPQEATRLLLLDDGALLGLLRDVEDSVVSCDMERARGLLEAQGIYKFSVRQVSPRALVSHAVPERLCLQALDIMGRIAATRKRLSEQGARAGGPSPPLEDRAEQGDSDKK